MKFRKPYKITRTEVNKEHWRFVTPKNYERGWWVITKYGIVGLGELDWETNKGNDAFTYFQTVFNGLHYSAFVDESKLTDRRAKWLSTYFIKRVVDGSWKDFQ